jgi:hypothetical protein
MMMMRRRRRRRRRDIWVLWFGWKTQREETTRKI